MTTDTTASCTFTTLGDGNHTIEAQFLGQGFTDRSDTIDQEGHQQEPVARRGLQANAPAGTVR